MNEWRNAKPKPKILDHVQRTLVSEERDNFGLNAQFSERATLLSARVFYAVYFCVHFRKDEKR